MAASRKLKVKPYYWRHHTLWIQAEGTELEQTWKSPTWELTVLVSNHAEQALKGEKSLTVLCSYKDCLLTVFTTWPTTPHSSHQIYSWSHSYIVPSTMHCILNPYIKPTLSWVAPVRYFVLGTRKTAEPQGHSQLELKEIWWKENAEDWPFTGTLHFWGRGPYWGYLSNIHLCVLEFGRCLGCIMFFTCVFSCCVILKLFRTEQVTDKLEKI